MGGYAWITLATNDPYCLGALVLAHSLKRVETKYDIAILITPGVTSAMREKLNVVFSVVKEVNVLDSKDEANLALLARPELGITFTKLHCWRMTQYEKCIFVDADALVIRNCDELFEREELSAAPDVGWPDCFNSGVFVFKPSEQTFASLASFAASKGSFDGGDQGLLNQYFSDWAHKDISKHLPFIYNMCSTATYSYLPAYKQYGNDVRIIHFIGNAKPWLQYFDTHTGQVHPSCESAHLQPLLQHWWNIFCEMVHPQLSSVMARSTLAPLWHDSYPHTSTNTGILNKDVVYNPTDLTNNQIDILKSNFSEFLDPWDNYIDKKYENNDINATDKNINLTDSINNEENEFFSNDVESCELIQRNNWINEKNNDHNNSSNYVMINSEHEHGENFENKHSISTPTENIEIIEPPDNIHHTNKCWNLQYYSNYKHSSNQTSINNNSDNIIHEHDQYDPEYYYDSKLNYQCDSNDENLTEDKNYHNYEHNNHAHIDILPINTQTHSQISTESESIVCQSKTNSLNEIAHDNYTGIAGALAKITLGTARSPEQEAFEEHMRKHSWEQGNIDYMGRDSFDNIWSKICTTIATVNEHESNDPQEGITMKDSQSQVCPVTESTHSNVQSTKTDAALSKVLQHHDVMTEACPTAIISQERMESNVPCCEIQSPTTKRLNITFPIEPPLVSAEIAAAQTSLDLSQQNSEQISTLACSTSQLCIEKSNDEYTSTPHIEKDTSICQPTVMTFPLPSIATSELVKLTGTQLPESSCDESRLIGDLANAKNVPIQVAESVLEADIKESVSEDIKPVSEEAISSVSAPIQESISTVVETPLEPPAPVHSQSFTAPLSVQANGTDLKLEFESIKQPTPAETPKSSITALSEESFPIAKTLLVSIPPSEPEIKELIGMQHEKTEEIAIQQKKIDDCKSVSDDSQMVTTQATTSKELTSETSKEDAFAASTTKQVINEDPMSTSNIPDDISIEISLKDTLKETKEQNEKPLVMSTESDIPGTPIITEATPPTSPPLDVLEAPLGETVKPTRKNVKKVSKKLSSDETTEGNETEESKKMKKTVKKGPSTVVKKCKESIGEGADSGTIEKPKKIIKVKKTSKTAQTLEADTSVPDTPPPTTSDTPVAPKRKVKSGIVKSPTTSINKPESEP